jgi:peptide/nickel transport system substrate-binding protein
MVVVMAFGGLAERTGAWVDQVVFLEEPTAAKAVDMVRNGDADLYTLGITEVNLIKTIVDNVGYEVSYGAYTEITCNPYGPEFKDDRLNPFSVPAIREALNWLIDRDYIIQNFYGGRAVARYFPISPVFPDYAKLADVARYLELRYAYDFEKAKTIITSEMQKLGATLVSNKWQYKGKPVVLRILIRTEDERKQIGDYVANQLEKLGFTTERLYTTAREALPLWRDADPADGNFHLYTGGWLSTVVSRDEAKNFDYFYTKRGRSEMLWQAYKPTPEFDQVSERLARGDFRTEEERRELMSLALRLSMEDSVRVWVCNRISYFARNKNISVSSDLAGGVPGSYLWSRTLKWTNKEGGTVNIAQPAMFVEAWNPIAGTTWSYDQMIIRGVSDYATLPDPYTGLYWPQNVEKVELTIVEGQPSSLTLELGKSFGPTLRGWVTQKFVPEIVVPADAWSDWDAVKKVFITAKDRFGGQVTAKSKAVVYYSESLFRRQWHDGSMFTLADMIMKFIMMFDRAKKESEIYDPAAVPEFETFMRYFKGLRLISTKPQVVVEVYSDLVYRDAEVTAADRAGYLWPDYGYGVAPWHTIALGICAEKSRKAAFSSSKAKTQGGVWMNYIGPAAEILEEELKWWVPEWTYEPTLGKYMNQGEANTRYNNVKAFFKKYGHFWISNGPLFVDKALVGQKIAVLCRFDGFQDPATKWDRFGKPKIANVAVTGPAVTRGQSAEFKIAITFQDKPYELAQLDFVKYLLFDANGQLVMTGTATPLKDGEFVVKLTSTDTMKLPVGKGRVDVVVVSKVVGIRSLAIWDFVVVR